MNIGEILRVSMLRDPNKEALVDRDKRFSYRQLYEETNRLSNALLDAGIGAGDRVALFLNNSAEQAIATLGIMQIGAIAVPINSRLATQELKFIASHSGSRLLFFDGELEETVARAKDGSETIERWVRVEPGGAGQVDALDWADFIKDASPKQPAVQVDESLPSVFMYTSGTTGLPKGVVLTHRSQWLNSLVCAIALGFRSTDRTLHIAPLFHAAAFNNVFLPHLQAGATNVVMRRYDPKGIFDLLRKEQITTMLGVPTHYDLMAQAGVTDTSNPLRVVTTGSAPTRWDTVEWIRANLCANLYVNFGMTEGTSLLSCLEPHSLEKMREENCIGRPIPNVEMRIIPFDYEGTDAEPPSVPTGEMGQLIIRAPFLMEGYYNNPAKTNEALRGGWLYSGDMGRKDEDGFIFVLGRIDDAIKSGGETVVPSEVEHVLMEHPNVQEAVVVGKPDQMFGQVLHAFIVPGEESLTAEELDRYLRDGDVLARYKRPRGYSFVPEIPKNPTGKVLKRELRRLLEEETQKDLSKA